MASDSRKTVSATGGATYFEQTRKLWSLTNAAGLLCAGAESGYAEYLIEEFRRKHTQGKPQVLSFEETIDKFRHHVKDDFDYHTSTTSASYLRDPFSGMEFIICGYGSAGEPRIARLVSSGEQITRFAPEYQSSCSIIGFQQIGAYWINRLKLRGGFGVESAKRLVAFIILETAKLTICVDTSIQMAVIEPKMGFQLVDEDEIENLRKLMSNVIDDTNLVNLLTN